ncbi:MAG: alanine--glyoxylate aminotransferase family protein [Candidatus Diapherotrites archaeon]|nr:alanine--glyoxylate aminotransferase family protein [Candidatus Diapherotrites archaeon]
MARLFIPGPISVPESTLVAMHREMIGHRGKEFSEVFANCAQGLKKVFYTNNRVLISTSSGSGLMEGAIRNCVKDKENVLMCSCGAFGRKWFDIAKACGKNTELFEISPGKGFRKEELEEKLKEKKYAAVCVTHNETSTGVMNQIEELAPVVKKHGAFFLVDAVSSMGGAKIEVDKIGIDVCITSSQKCFALPPGLSFASVSEGVLNKAKGISERGFYFDFVELAKEYDTNQTPYTPAVGLFFGLKERLEVMNAEGMENIWKRHEKLASITQNWARGNGMSLFAEEKYRSNTVTCIENTKKVNLEEVKKKVKAKGYVMDAGYRKMNEELLKQGKNETFRIPHMGPLTVEELNKYLEVLASEMGL